MAKTKPEEVQSPPPAPFSLTPAPPPSQPATKRTVRPMSTLMRAAVRIERILGDLPTEEERRKAYRIVAAMIEDKTPTQAKE
jgi:hypothetical protein